MLDQIKKRVGVRVDPSTWSIKEWKQVDRRRITADALINPGPGFVFALTISCDVTGPALATLYDGHNVGGEPVITLSTIASLSFNYNWNPPLYFRKGIYIGNISAIIGLTIQWLPWNP